ncbi:MAG TPA: type VI secretion system baseplate subunit TssG [Smithellaceae bacterium]|nr:type VI secretion system baseplate subunit TssG [Smithellaceae bacterium]
MAAETGQPTFDIADELTQKGPQFSFLQVMRLLRRMGHLPESVDDPAALARRERTVQIRPENHLAFPASDVASVERTGTADHEGYTVNATFLGLYGPASPLPTFYTEDLIQQELADEPVVRDFLDIINHRLFALFFQCCMKYRLFFRICEEQNRQTVEKLFCLFGLGESLHRQQLPLAYPLIRYIGILSQHPRSAWGLETILSDALDHTPVKVRQCRRRIVNIPFDQRFYLGEESCTLGEDSIVGRQMEDYCGKFLISVGPVSFVRFQALLPGNPENERIALMTRFYLQDPLEYDMELILKKDETATVRLSGLSSSRLGLDTWVFANDKIGEVGAVFPMTM